MQTDVVKAARADPSALVAAQLNLSLHTLGEQLPLFDGVTGRRVAPETDRIVDAVRDRLMDDAAEYAEELPEEVAKGAVLPSFIVSSSHRHTKVASETDRMDVVRDG